MRRPPSIPPTQSRQRPRELDAELRRHEETTTTTPAAAEHPKKRLHQSTVSNRLRERLEELRAAERRSRAKTIGYVAAAAGIIGVVVWVVAFSPFLAFSGEFTLEGADSYITEEEISQVVAGEEGTPLIRVNTGELQNQLVEEFPLKDAIIARQWPQGLRIYVDERTGVAQAPRKSGFAILDGEGVELGKVKKKAEGLPVVDVDSKAEDLPIIMSAILHVMDELPEDIRSDVTKVGANTPDDITFNLESGAKVMWGSDEDTELKAEVLSALLEVPADLYNVVSPHSPITS